MSLFSCSHHVVVLFALLAFCGWLIEVAWRSTTRKRFVNAGFLYGPFVPIYGFGAIAVSRLDGLLIDSPILVKALAFGVTLTALEYATGYLFERLFRLRLWDYSNHRLNLHGRVSLLFSVFWTALALIYVNTLAAPAFRLVRSLDVDTITVASYVTVAVMGTDLVCSVASLAALRDTVTAIELRSLGSFRRLRDAFPHLDAEVLKAIIPRLRDTVAPRTDHPRTTIPSESGARSSFHGEYDAIVRDIAAHADVLRLKEFRHHNSSVFEHVQRVSYLSYRVCKTLGLDYTSAARGGLLHDFFLYDWHHHDVPDLPKETNHGVAHPKIALQNSQARFEVTATERDIILRHMWPLTMRPPAYKESYVVSFVDKYVAAAEYLDMITGAIATLAPATRHRPGCATKDAAGETGVRSAARLPRSERHRVGKKSVPLP